MKNRLLTMAGAGVLILGGYHAKPLVAQARAALIQNVDEPGRHVFGFYASNLSNPADFPIPAGKRYVVEQFSADCNVKSGFALGDVRIRVLTEGKPMSASAAPHFVEREDQLRNLWSGSGTTRLYADPGTFIEMTTFDTAGALGDTEQRSFSVSGYSIDVP
jgi:hypothetical protein